MRTLLFPLLLLFTLAAQATTQPALVDLLNKKLANGKARQAAITAGNDRALLCKYCHGKDGNSVKNTIPNLAEQNPLYLLNQFELFASGKRINKTMNELSKILKDEDRVNIAIFYASQQALPKPGYKSELTGNGQQIYTTKCFMCHGQDAHGTGDFPRLAGQPPEYIVRTLTSYRSSLVKRAQTAMSGVASTLEKNEIEALAAYLSALD